MHPDADQLSIFVDGEATGRERERMLAHLADCEECRDAVFLMQAPEKTPAPVTRVSKEPVWRRWLIPVGLAGALLACGFTAVVVYLRPPTSVPEKVRQNADLREQPVIGPNEKLPVPGSNVAPAPQPEKPKSSLERGTVALNAIPQDARRATSSKAATHKETGVPSGSPGTTADAGPARQPATLPSVSDAEATQTVKSSTAPANLPVLKVESGLDNTLSGISGYVTDPSGAVIPKATVALRNVSGNTQQTATGADGSFRLTDIPAGHYDLTITAPGFKSNQQSIDLKPSELAVLQPVLGVGEVTQSVEVTASNVELQTMNASIGPVAAPLPSRLPVASSVSLGKRILSLDRGGSLFLSRNAGKSWKKIKPQWTGKAVRIDLAAAKEAAATRKSEASGMQNARSVFQLTTDNGAEWTSKDGAHWRAQ